MIELIQMQNKDIKPLKEKLWEENDKKCPLLGIEVSLDKMVLDHIHKLKSEDLSIDKGTIRNALEFRANALEGKITNNWKRYFGSDESKHPISLPNFLRNLADYLEKGAYIEGDKAYIHPSEKKKEPNLSKKNYNKAKKLYNAEEFVPKRKNQKKKPMPEYPKSGKATKIIKEIFSKYNIELYN